MTREGDSPHWNWIGSLPDLREGLCVGDVDPDMWFSEDPVDERLALGYCRICPVREACLESAYEEERQTGYYAFGIRGGVRDRNRQRKLDIMRRKDGATDE